MGSSISIRSAGDIISHSHSEPKEQVLIFDCDQIAVSQYIQAINKIQQSGNPNELDDIISIAVSRLKYKFQTILTRQTKLLMEASSVSEFSSSSEDYVACEVACEVPSKEAINDLRSIAEWMSSCGHLGACIKVYNKARKRFVNTIFKRLHLEELHAGDTKRLLREELKMKIAQWIRAAKVCTEILFAREKQLAKLIFGGLGISTHDECFLHTVKDAATNLLSFAEAVSFSHQPSERLEIILILYDAFSSVMLHINALFQLESAKGIRNATAAILSRLQDEVRRMLSDFENAVLNELSTISDDGGIFHPITKYVMEYISLILKYRELLMDIIVSRPSMTIGNFKLPDEELQGSKSLSPLSLHMVLIIAVLQNNLEVKSKYYKDASLGYLFMMNNVHYIAKKIEGSKELKEMIGADYLNKLTENVKQAISSFLALTCDRLLDCLRDEGLYVTQCFSSRVSKSALRKRIEAFNCVVEEMRLLQSQREIPDMSLREELRHSMLEKLLPAYECFLRKFRCQLESGKQRKACSHHFQGLHIKYSVKDLEALVLKDLLEHDRLCPLTEVPAESIHLLGGHMERC